MKAVNLIPVEDRRSAGAPGRTGGAVYVYPYDPDPEAVTQGTTAILTLSWVVLPSNRMSAQAASDGRRRSPRRSRSSRSLAKACSRSVADSWTATSSTSSASPPRPVASVLTEVQPSCGARTMANTTAARPAVTVAALVRSSEPRRVIPAGSTERVTAEPDLSSSALYFNRELSWLDFNERVLALADEAEDPRQRELVAHLRSEVNAGSPFARALAGAAGSVVATMFQRRSRTTAG